MSKLISQDLSVTSIGVKDPFLVQCAGHNYRHNANRYRTAPSPVLPDPLRLPTDPSQCCWMSTVELPGEEPEVYSCQHRAYKGVHGFLCKGHHEEATLLKKKQSLMKWPGGGVDLADLLPTLQNEVDTERLIVAHLPSSVRDSLDYKSYVQWGWTRIDPERPLNHYEDYGDFLF